MKRICSIILALCLLGSQTVYAAVGTEGVGSDSTIKIEIVDSLDQRVDLNVFVEDEAGTPLEGVTIKLLDPDNSDIPPITGADQNFMTDDTGHLLIKLFPQNTQSFQIEIKHTGYMPYMSERFQVTEDSEHIAVLKRVIPPIDDYYTVYYYYVLADGTVVSKSERVPWNEMPQQVPIPVPEEGWEFVGWTLDGKPVVPETVKIRKTTRFFAEFRKIPPVVPPTPTPTHTIDPEETLPPEESPAPTATVPAGPGDNQGGGTSNGGDTPNTPPPEGTPPPEETSPSGGEETPPPEETKAPDPDIVPPEEPEQEIPPGPPVCHRHWIILALTLMTGLTATLRLGVLRWRIEELEAMAELEEQEEVSPR